MRTLPKLTPKEINQLAFDYRTTRNENIYAKLYNSIQPYVVAATKIYVQWDIEDTLAQSNAQIFKHIDKWNVEVSAFTTWCYEIASNRSKKELRRRFNSDSHRSNSSIITLSDSKYSTDPDNINDRLADQQKISEIFQIISNLPTDLRIPLQLHLEGLSYLDISTILKTNMQTVKNRIHRARKHIQHLK